MPSQKKERKKTSTEYIQLKRKSTQYTKQYKININLKIK